MVARSHIFRASSAFHLQSAVISAVHDQNGWQDVGEERREEKKEEGSQTHHAGLLPRALVVTAAQIKPKPPCLLLLLNSGDLLQDTLGSRTLYLEAGNTYLHTPASTCALM